MSGFSNIVALGAGRMGRGIAHMFAYAGHAVHLLDVKERKADGFTSLKTDAGTEIRKNLEFLSAQNIITAAQVDKVLALISIHSLVDAEEVLAQADIILEGVPETIEAKNSAFELLDRYSREDAVITSTTSTMSVAELQNKLRHPKRFLNTHFLNPAYLIPLVEISPSPLTEESVVEAVIDLFKLIGKQPVRCAAKPGYIIPRLQSLLMAEACRMIEEGVVTPEDLDKAIKYGFGPRYAAMGVVEFMDWGGLDTVYYAGHHLADGLESEAHRPPPLIKDMLDEGKGGLRAGQGFYDFRQMDVEDWQDERLSRFVTLLGQLDQIPTAGV